MFLSARSVVALSLLGVLLSHIILVIDAFSSRTRSKIATNMQHGDTNRRSLIFGGAAWAAFDVFLLFTPFDNASAIGEGAERMVFKEKPTAPVGALIPAVQQRLLLEAALDFAKRKELDKVKQIMSPLDDDSYIPNIGGSQNMKIIQQYNPATVLRGDLVRATMNLYQTNLNYNNLLNNPEEAFTVTDPSWKKSYIRANNGLPDLKKLIGADLDMRQLLRNQVQLKIDDAAAELYASDCDNEELVSLLQEATQNFDLWLNRVRTGDVRDALKAALAGESVKIYDSYAAGFLPPTDKKL